MSEMFPTQASPEAADAVRNAASQLARATDAVRDAGNRLYDYERACAVDARRLEELTEALAAATAAELTGEDAVEAPDPAEIEALRTRLSIADRVKAELRHKVAASEGTAERAKSAHHAAVRSLLTEIGVDPAREKVESLFDQFGDALAELMAAHRLTYAQFRDPSAHNTGGDYNDLFGPAMHFVRALQDVRWETFPYTVRPGWLPLSGPCWPDEWSATRAADAELRAKIAAEGAL